LIRELRGEKEEGSSYFRIKDADAAIRSLMLDKALEIFDNLHFFSFFSLNPMDVLFFYLFFKAIIPEQRKKSNGILLV